jgi:hypothetical protein
MKPGEVEPVQRRVLVDQLGAGIARELGLMDQEKEIVQGRRPQAGSRDRPRQLRPAKREGTEPKSKGRRRKEER